MCGYMTVFSPVKGELEGYIQLSFHFPNRKLLDLDFLFFYLLAGWKADIRDQP